MLNIFKSKTEKAINKYGMYGIPYEVAKTLKEFGSICYKPNGEKISDKELKKYRERINSYSRFDNYKGGLEVFEFGHIDIELNITERGSYGKKDLLDFFVCVEYKEQGWESYLFSDYIVKIEDLESLEKLEEVMYNELMKFAKKFSLKWNELN